MHRLRFAGFNILASAFGAFSIMTVVPFLQIIFNLNPSNQSSKTALVAQTGLINELNEWLKIQIMEWGPFYSLVFFSCMLVFMFLLKNLCLFVAFTGLSHMRAGIGNHLRQLMYHKLLKLPMSFYSSERKGDLITRATNDVREIEWSFIGVLEMILKHPFMLLIPFGLLFYISWQLTLFVVIVLPMSGYIISRLAKKLKKAARLGTEKLGDVISQFEETLGGIKIIKAFNAENRSAKHFDEKNDEHFRLTKKVLKREYAASPLSEFMGSIVMSSILIFAGRLILNNNFGLSGEMFIMYIAMFSQLIPPAKALSESYFRLEKGMASMERINEVLHTEDGIHELPNTMEVQNFKDSLTFKGVSFSYIPNTPVLTAINIVFKRGEKVALVGSSGAGKSTIADLVLRFNDPNTGEILYDGINIKQLSLRGYRNKIAVVTQEPILFNDTVENNLKLGNPEATFEEMVAAAKQANAHNFIEPLEDGYQSMIGERGGKLSGGQKQRLTIARAILSNPEILVLDEATSALDSESEKLVNDALEKLMENRTSIIIAHRLSTIQNADKIIVLEHGQIVETGTHLELIQKNGIYNSLYKLQSLG
jgi:subfamily B ATP-binding cassette protein MsbA